MYLLFFNFTDEQKKCNSCHFIITIVAPRSNLGRGEISSGRVENTFLDCKRVRIVNDEDFLLNLIAAKKSTVKT